MENKTRKSLIKRVFVISIFILFLYNIGIGYLLIKSRLFSHLAIWKIIETNKQEDLYWSPENSPKYFSFEAEPGKLLTFKNEIEPYIKNENDEFKIILETAKYIIKISSNNSQSIRSVKWDSPEGILKQVKKGANANCFHRAILFSTCLASLGIKSRVWAVENEKFNDIPHSVNEVYLKSMRKWVFIDTMFGFYVTENNVALSLLELRERLLNGNSTMISVHNLGDVNKRQKEIPRFYKQLVQCVFLRTGNNFIDKYNTRYGAFSVFKKYLDRLPGRIRKGVSYFFAEGDIFIHYVDKFSRSLGPGIIIAKLLFYFLIFSSVLVGIAAVTFALAFLKHSLLVNLSKKDTPHT